MDDLRDLCANCDHWREEHYDRATGAFQGDLFGCGEYQGVAPDEDRRELKVEQLRKSRERIQQLRSQKATAFYDEAPAPAKAKRS